MTNNEEEKVVEKTAPEENQTVEKEESISIEEDCEGFEEEEE